VACALPLLIAHLPNHWGFALPLCLFGAFHGNAHALEGDPQLPEFSYGLGFVLATMGLHLVGISTIGFLKKLLSSTNLRWMLRLLGSSLLLSCYLLA
jgi:hydrogenase/urease accessory protein HupE